jgi:hypothetical protein
LCSPRLVVLLWPRYRDVRLAALPCKICLTMPRRTLRLPRLLYRWTAALCEDLTPIDWRNITIAINDATLPHCIRVDNVAFACPLRYIPSAHWPLAHSVHWLFWVVLVKSLIGLIYIYLCTQLRNDHWKNDDCAPAAASESVGIKVLIYFGLFGASQRQEPFVGPVWPIIGTTQGVATEVAACACDTFSFQSRQRTVSK